MLSHSHRGGASPTRSPGFGNRRSLMADLEAQLRLATIAEHPGRSCCSTSTASRSTTTPSATRPATGCWSGCGERLAEAVGATATPTGWAATSSACSDARPRRASTGRRGAARPRWPSTARASRSTTSLRRRAAAEEADDAHRGAPARRPAHVRAQGRPADVGRPPVARRPAAHALRARSPDSSRSPSRHRPSWRWRSGVSCDMGPRGARRGGPRRRAPRRRQDRDPGRDPRQAGPARRGRVGLHAPAHR